MPVEQPVAARDQEQLPDGPRELALDRGPDRRGVVAGRRGPRSDGTWRGPPWRAWTAEGLEPDDDREQRGRAAAINRGGAARVAISTQASTRRWAGVRHEVGDGGLVIEAGLGLGPSSSKSSRSIMRSVSSTIVPDTGSSVARPNHMPPKLWDRCSSRALRSDFGALLGAIGVDEQVPAVAGAAEVGEAVAQGDLEEPFVIGLERLGGARVPAPRSEVRWARSMLPAAHAPSGRGERAQGGA